MNTWEEHSVLCLGFDCRVRVITSLVYSTHEISDYDRRCCFQSRKPTPQWGMWSIFLLVIHCQKPVLGDRVILNKDNELKTNESGPPPPVCQEVLTIASGHGQAESAAILMP